MLARIVYYEVVAHIPGSMAALMSVVIYSVSQLLLGAVIILLNLFAKACSTRSARNTIWGRMMGVQTGFY